MSCLKIGYPSKGNTKYKEIVRFLRHVFFISARQMACEIYVLAEISPILCISIQDKTGFYLNEVMESCACSEIKDLNFFLRLAEIFSTPTFAELLASTTTPTTSGGTATTSTRSSGRSTTDAPSTSCRG